jgi:hypothetical protein
MKKGIYVLTNFGCWKLESIIYNLDIFVENPKNRGKIFDLRLPVVIR